MVTEVIDLMDFYFSIFISDTRMLCASTALPALIRVIISLGSRIVVGALRSVCRHIGCVANQLEQLGFISGICFLRTVDIDLKHGVPRPAGK